MKKGKVNMAHKFIREPVVELRAEQPYVAIPVQATLREWGKTAALVSEIFDWIDKKGLEPVGAPFYRYWCIGGLDEEFTLEVGVPIEHMVAGDDRVVASSIPGGSYATAMHRGHPDMLAGSLEGLEKWAKTEGLEFDKRWEEEEEIWNGRFEFYLTDPETEPDPAKWEIELAFLLMRDEAA